MFKNYIIYNKHLGTDVAYQAKQYKGQGSSVSYSPTIMEWSCGDKVLGKEIIGVG